MICRINYAFFDFIEVREQSAVYRNAAERGLFVKFKDSDGKPIKIGGVRFIENDSKYDLNNRQVAKVRDTVLNHSRQATENKKKIAVLKNGDKKKKQD